MIAAAESSAVVIVAALVTGSLGLLGVGLTAVLARRTGRDSTANATIETALATQGAQITRLEAKNVRQEERIDALEDEVRQCHTERDADRAAYRAELDQLRARIEETP